MENWTSVSLPGSEYISSLTTQICSPRITSRDSFVRHRHNGTLESGKMSYDVSTLCSFREPPFCKVWEMKAQSRQYLDVLISSKQFFRWIWYAWRARLPRSRSLQALHRFKLCNP